MEGTSEPRYAPLPCCDAPCWARIALRLPDVFLQTSVITVIHAAQTLNPKRTLLNPKP